MTKILKNLFLLFSIAATLIYFTSCEKYSYIIEPVVPPEDPVFYNLDIQPVFDAKCVRCHAGALSPDLRPDNSYKALSEGGYITLPAEGCKLYDYVINKTSHASYTSQEEKGTIYAWLLQGAENIEYTEEN